VPRVLRDGLLEGRTVALAGGASAAGSACAALGARTPALEADLLDEDAVTAAASALGAVDALICDAATRFVAVGGGLDGLRVALDGAWNATRAVANACLRPAGAGKIVLLAPAPGSGAHARALRAALENLARTTSVEWARYGLTPTAILPGDDTAEDEVAQLCAWLASPAGDYFSGCAFTLGSLRAGSQSAQGTSTESSVGESRATT
jgi:NAD(P)-dependent dehydrogenase (short-subunit alcohol dehydrogenase family)